VQGASDLDPAWFSNIRTVGVTAGSSTPDYVIVEVEERLSAM
jgi:4-hydroxy-3-methylbut-2-enyl diphosphate reductase IspH